MRKVTPAEVKNGNVVTWKISENTDTYYINGTTTTVPFDFSGFYVSNPLGTELQSDCYRLREFLVRRDGEIIYQKDNFIPVPCEEAEDDCATRVWIPNYPEDLTELKRLLPGERINIVINEEFSVPSGEEFRIRWERPRKSLSYTIEYEDELGQIPTLSLTGCSLCDGGLRRHRCTECTKPNSGITSEPHRRIRIEGIWAGSDLGINVEWSKKTDKE